MMVGLIFFKVIGTYVFFFLHFIDLAFSIPTDVGEVLGIVFIQYLHIRGGSRSWCYCV